MHHTLSAYNIILARVHPKLLHDLLRRNCVSKAEESYVEHKVPQVSDGDDTSEGASNVTQRTASIDFCVAVTPNE